MTNNLPSVEEVVETFEKAFVDTQYVVGTNKKAYQEWKYGEDAEEAIDWLRTALTAMYEKGLRDGREPYIIRDVAIDLRTQVNERDNQ
jgi:hypothetical protein